MLASAIYFVALLATDHKHIRIFPSNYRQHPNTSQGIILTVVEQYDTFTFVERETSNT
jgi:hypothetical protein